MDVKIITLSLQCCDISYWLSISWCLHHAYYHVVVYDGILPRSWYLHYNILVSVGYPSGSLCLHYSVVVLYGVTVKIMKPTIQWYRGIWLTVNILVLTLQCWCINWWHCQDPSANITMLMYEILYVSRSDGLH